jgi:ABC-type transporter Mla subunit MlaD
MKTKILICVLLLAVVFGTYFLYKGYRNNKEDVRATFLKDERVKLDRKVAQLELVFKQIYQGARTISLLPSIRGLEGGNLPEGFEGKYDLTRFSADAHSTVQQIYNNLSSNVSVSEVYCILKGFRPSQGETPFFMYDSLIVDDDSESEEGAGQEEHHDPDAPEESEGYEYDYYIKQLALFEGKYPRFQFTSIDEIPCFGSPAMRTCDNTQYSSKSSGNVEDAFGMLFSVPVYSRAQDFLGIVSVIVRLNTFEALLLDRPFVIVTEQDKEQAAQEGWTMPEDPGRFVLRNSDSEMNITISDRRNEDIISQANAAIADAGSELILRETLDLPTRTSWELQYVVNESALSAKLTSLKKMFVLKTLLSCFGAVILMYWVVTSKKQLLIKKLKQAIGRLQSCSEQVSSASGQISSASQSLAEGSSEQAAGLEETSSSLEEMASMTKQNADNAQQANTLAGEARKAADTGGEAMRRMGTAINDIQKSSDETAKIIKVIDEIAFQTNLLALNAAVEAARAGEAGKGFAVVAEEVRNLALRSAEAAKNTSAMIEESVKNSKNGVDIASEVGKVLEEIVQGIGKTTDLVGEIAAASQEQAQGIDQVNTAMAQMDKVTQQNAANAEESASASEELSVQAESMNEVVGELVALVGGSSATKQSKSSGRRHLNINVDHGAAQKAHQALNKTKQHGFGKSDQAFHKIANGQKQQQQQQ